MEVPGPGGRKRLPQRLLGAEDEALNQIAREAEARLAAKRAARAEAREIRMKELERQQKEIYQVQKKYYGLDTKWGDIEQWMEDSERYSHRARRNTSVSDEDERMSVGSRGSLRYPASISLPLRSQTQDVAVSSQGTYHSDLGLPGCGSNSKSQATAQNGSRPSLLTFDAVPSRSYRAPLYDDSLYSGSRRYSASSSRGPSEYSCYLGSGSRASSRTSSARASPVVEERPDKEFNEKGSRTASSLSAATLASLGGTSSRRGSGDTSISVDTEASIREIKDISELKDQIQDVEGRYMQGLKEMKDSLAELEEKYKKAMVSNAQLDNEKTNFMYQVDTLKDVLLELEEQLAETQRQYEDKNKEFEREKHAHQVLQIQYNAMKESLQQKEEMLTEIHKLQQKQENNIREISDLQETIEWKDKKIGALERQKDFFDSIRSERDELRDEVAVLKEELKRHGIVLSSDLSPNGGILDGPYHERLVDSSTKGDGDVTPVLKTTGDGPLDIRLKKLVEERELFLEQIKRLKAQIEGKPKNTRTESPDCNEEVLENGDANRQISDLKFKLAKSEQEITALEQNVMRLEAQVTRYRSAAENAEKVEDELKAEKRKLQRELRTYLDKIEELEVSNSHLSKRLEKMKANRSALLSQQ
ncbi:leucine-rich repeat flightless-interacting protein 1 isoform X23 [Pleurodeles waltl]|uniref:leucine-rich repeat flightless-interacting protein 1 isoform X23 n=1 Tax=Pleurodeles waltl TaxID=8319 RepID=UPI003709A53B